jgi:hypothetical protein
MEIDEYTRYCIAIGKERVEHFCKLHQLTRDQFNLLIEYVKKLKRN